MREDCFRSEPVLADLERIVLPGITHTKLGGRTTLRVAIGVTWTEHRHVEAAWRRIVETAARLEREPPSPTEAARGGPGAGP